MSKKYTHCAECGKELGSLYYAHRDNFQEENNAFCSEWCAISARLREEIERGGYVCYAL
jgi:hypothetical protein